MEVELKHKLAVSRDAWWIRLYQFVWCSTVPVKARAPRITFCALFWGYILMPLGLALSPLVYGAGWGYLAALKIGKGFARVGYGIGWAVASLSRPVRVRRRAAALERVRERERQLAESDAREAALTARLAKIRWVSSHFDTRAERRAYWEEHYPDDSVPQSFLPPAPPVPFREASRNLRRRPDVRGPILHAAMLAGAFLVLAAMRLGEFSGGAIWAFAESGWKTGRRIIRFLRFLGSFRGFWRRFRWTSLVAFGGLAFAFAGYVVFRTASTVAHGIEWLAVHTFESVLWVIVHTATGIAWLAVVCANAVWWLIVHTVLGFGWCLQWFAVHVIAAFAVLVAVHILTILLWAGLVAGGVGLAVFLAFMLAGAAPTIARGITKGADSAADVAYGGLVGFAASIRLLGQALKIGYVAVKSNTCPQIVFTEDEE